MNDKQLIEKIIKLNAEIQALTEARDELRAQLCASHEVGEMLHHGDTRVSFSVRHTINAAAVEKMPAFKRLPKAVRESCYDKPKLNTKKVAALELIDLSPATKVSEVYVTFR